MGMTIFEQSGTFDPSRYGLGIGSVLHVIVVGGGESGRGSDNSSNPGGDSSFGTLVTAKGGSIDLITGMGLGGKSKEASNSGTYSAYGGGGAGGYLPGVPIYGGAGGGGGSTTDAGNSYYSAAGDGGNSGELKMVELVLSSTDTIPVTVGLGGDTYSHTRTISGGYTAEITGHSGSNGVVIVCW